jgi:6-pyruvoyl tetrahydropterin synthase/QueD family protein
MQAIINNARPRSIQTLVSKTFRWEMAHRLVKGYEGKCNSLHGHSWEATITVSQAPGFSTLDPFDMVVDFGDFKPVRQWVDTYWDHAVMLYAHDPLLELLAPMEDQRVWPCNANPTSETIAEMLAALASNLIVKEREDIFVKMVEVKETCTSTAVWICSK